MKHILTLTKDHSVGSLLKRFQEIYGYEIKYYFTQNVNHAIEMCSYKIMDLVIVDLELNGSVEKQTQLIFLEMIRQLKHYQLVPIIAVGIENINPVSLYENYHCFRFIPKPIYIRELFETLEEAIHYSQKKEVKECIFLRNGGKIYIIQKNWIYYAFSQNSVMHLVTRKGEYIFQRLSCEKLLSELYDTCFFLCRRDLIVNQNYISWVNFQEKEIGLLECGAVVKLGPTYIPKLRRRLGIYSR